MRPADRRRRLALVLAVFLTLLAGTVTVAYYLAVVASRDASSPASSRMGIVGTIRATASTGRQGAYYLPPDHESEALPLLVMLHGTGGKGSVMILHLRELAERRRFIAVAPDSVSVAGAWLVAQGPQGVSEDHRHVMESVREVLALRGVQVDRAHVLIAGFSVGGGAAAHIASHEDLFSAFAVLHGHMVVAGLGPRRVRGWLSTGDRDRLRTVESFRSLADQLTRDEAFLDVEAREFRVDHTLPEEELAALVAWWLRRQDSQDAQRSRTAAPHPPVR